MAKRPNEHVNLWQIPKRTRKRQAALIEAGNPILSDTDDDSPATRDHEIDVFLRNSDSNISRAFDDLIPSPPNANVICAPNSPVSPISIPDSHTDNQSSTETVGSTPKNEEISSNEEESEHLGVPGSIPEIETSSEEETQYVDVPADNAENRNVAVLPIPDFDRPEPSDDGADDSNHSDDDGDNIQPAFEDDDNNFHYVEDEPLYPGAPLSKAESFLSILALSVRHKLNGVCLSDIIKLVDLHCPKPKSSLYSFSKHFEDMQKPLICHFYCKTCYTQCELENTCPVCGETKVNYLIVFPVISQLETMLSRDGFYESLNYRFTRQKVKNENIEDIYDGELYKDQCTNGFLTEQSSISFTWYTDGANVFKSSKICIWPVYLSINELPPSKRMLKENVVFASLWCGSDKPIGNIMLEPLREEMTQLYNGIPVTAPDVGRINLRGLILCGTGDTPARELFMGINQHTGSCSCTKCRAMGERIEHVQVFPYEPELALRTVENMRRDASFAMQLPPDHPDGHINGVKGPTELDNLMPNFVRAMAIDEMHNVQGVVKKLLRLLFDSSYHMFDFNRSLFIGVVDERLLKIKPPAFIKRKPRSLKDHLCYYKMSELKSLAFYYMIPILRGVISQDHYRHLILLIVAIWILSGKSIAEEDIQKAQRLINEFVGRFAELYHLKFLTINVHLLLHLPSVVRDLGPLWTTSCFAFEDLNGQILSMVHGTRFTERQISSSVQQYMALPQLVSDLRDGPAKAFCSELIKRGRKPGVSEEVGVNIGVVGNCIRMERVPENIFNVLHANDIPARTVFKFQRLYKDGLVYTTRDYDAGKSSNSSCISFKNHEVEGTGIVRTYIKALNCDCHEECEHRGDYLVLVNPCQKVESLVSAEPYVEVPPIHKFEISDETIIAIRPSEIVSMNVIMFLDDGIYIARPQIMSEFNV